MEYPSTSAPRMQGWCNRLNTNTWREQALSTVGAGQKRNGHISHYTNKHQLIYIYIQKTSRQRKNVKMNPKLPHRHGQPGFWSKKWHPPRSWGLGFSPGKVSTASKTHAKRQIHLQNLLFFGEYTIPGWIPIGIMGKLPFWEDSPKNNFKAPFAKVRGDVFFRFHQVDSMHFGHATTIPNKESWKDTSLNTNNKTKQVC